MKSDGLSKLYDTLSIEERFQPRLRAFARRDRADCDRLDRTCPSYQYHAYSARIDASDVLTLCALVDIMPKLAKLQMVAAIRPLVECLQAVGHQAGWQGYLDGFSTGWRAAGKRGEPPQTSEDDLTAAADRAYSVGRDFGDVLDQIAASVAASARTTRDGLGAFAETELGVSVDVLFGAWGGPSVAMIAEHADALDAAEANSEDLDLFAKTLDLAWRRHGLMDGSAEPDPDLREAIEAAGW